MYVSILRILSVYEDYKIIKAKKDIKTCWGKKSSSINLNEVDFSLTLKT